MGWARRASQGRPGVEVSGPAGLESQGEDFKPLRVAQGLVQTLSCVQVRQNLGKSAQEMERDPHGQMDVDGLPHECCVGTLVRVSC